MSKREYTCLFLMMLLPILMIGQKQNDIWLFGFGAGLDFSTGTPVKIENALMFSKEGCAVISDKNGQLLFYSNGVRIWNANHQVMSNGNGLKGGIETSSTNQAIIVPYPNQPNLYYVFTTDERAGIDGLHYSIVDMSLNNGLGNVSEKNTPIYAPTTERLALARHADGESFWLVTHGWENNEFITYAITENGFNDYPIISKVGVEHHPRNSSNLNSRGCISFNSDFTKMAIAVYKDNFVELFDFDTCEGKISNTVTSNKIDLPYGLAFSPNDNWLYVTNLDGELYQMDANATTNDAFENSLNLVGETDKDNLSAIQQGPDKKLYVAIPNAHHLGVINQPNIRGLSCDYQDLSIDLGTGISTEGLPSQLPFVNLKGQDQTQFINATISMKEEGACANEPIDFYINTNENVKHVIWSFNDESIFESLKTTQIFRDTGMVMVSAIISNQCKLDTLSNTINIRDCDFPLFIPNAFSPNNDGNNDLFAIQGALGEIQKYEIVVFSRWGDSVFRSTDPYTAWNGQFKGQKMDEGVFIWIVKVKFFGITEEFVLSGDLTLLR